MKAWERLQSGYDLPHKIKSSLTEKQTTCAGYIFDTSSDHLEKGNFHWEDAFVTLAFSWLMTDVEGPQPVMQLVVLNVKQAK